MANTLYLLMYAVASKCGHAVFEDGAITNSASHIRTYIDGSTERLGFAPDLYYLHRMDPSKQLTQYHPFASISVIHPRGKFNSQ
jgi:aryl-alcohol dehydrogenase-like predicted oxidoreductase